MPFCVHFASLWNQNHPTTPKRGCHGWVTYRSSSQMVPFFEKRSKIHSCNCCQYNFAVSFESAVLFTFLLCKRKVLHFPGEEKYYWRSDSPQSTSHVSTGAFRMWTAVLKTLGITGETLRKMRFNFHTLPFNETIRKREGKRNCTKKGLFDESSKKLIPEQSSSNSETLCGGAIIWRTLSAIFSSNRLLPRQQTSNTRVTPMLWPLVKLTADCIKSCPWFYAVLSATSLTLHQLMSSSFIHEAEILKEHLQ